MIIQENRPIRDLTTMRIGGPADYVLSVEDTDDVKVAYAFAEERGLPVWVMGRGANTIGHDEGFRGVIILNKLRSIEIIDESDDNIIIRAAGGEIWDDLVRYTAERGYSGIEAMSMIPSTVGAAPVQNIGAYGQDISQVIISAEAYDTKTKEYVTITKDDMHMGYRHTRFNAGEDVGRFFITAITIKLSKGTLTPPFYNSLQSYIEAHNETDYSPQNIRRMVCEIRSSKLPDPDEIASAGSFFKNITLDKPGVAAAKAENVPVWENSDGSGKINSGWLIEECGLKGKLLYGFRVSDKAALVLINESGETYKNLATARAEIIDTVKAKFGYTLEQEPVEIPVNGGFKP